MTYQLYYSPEMAKLNQLGPVLQLEKRIDRLERLLGNDEDKLVTLIITSVSSSRRWT